MSIQPPNGILDITGATLRVSKMEFSNVTGFDTVLNNVARNTVLHVDTTEYTANVAYAVKPPNMFMAQFDLELAAGGTGLPCNFNYYNDSNLGTSFNGYNLSFNDTSIILTYDGGSALHTATLSSSLNNGVYRKVKVLFDRDTTLVSINGENVFRFKDELRPRTYDTGTTGYIRWWHNSPVARKIKNLKVSNGEKWAQEYDSAGLSSNISYTHGLVGVGTSVPEYTLDVAGDIRASGNLIINGSNTLINTTSLAIEDGVIECGKGNSSAAKDLGFLMVRNDGSSTTNSNVAMFWDESTDALTFGFSDSGPTATTLTPNTTKTLNSYFVGNVGIGTNNPFGKLQVDIADASAATATWDATKVVFGDITNGNSQGLGFGVSTNSHASIISLAPGVAWRGLGYYSAWHKWYINNVEKMVLDASGKIGIGTASPQEKFHLYGSPMIQHETRYSASSNPGWYKLGTWDAPDASGSRLKISLLGGESYSALSAAKGGETIIYASINNNNPTTVSNMSGSIHAYGNPVITQAKFKQVGTDRSQYEIYAYVESFTQHSMKIECTNTSTFTRAWTGSTDPGADSSTVQAALFTHVVDNVGYFGIGTVSPKNKLDVRSDNYATFGKATYNAAGWSGIRLGTPYATNHDAYCSVIESYNNHASDYNSDLRFKTSNGNNASGNERMRITSAGNVGIGTTNPSVFLHIVDPNVNSTTELLRLEKANANGDINNASIGYIGMHLQDGNAGGGEVARISYGHTGDNIQGSGTGQNPEGKGKLGFWTSDTGFADAVPVERMTINHKGNVGIGTVSPGAPLHINDSTDMTTASEVLRLNRGSSGDDINSASRGSIGMYLQDTANPYEVARISWQHDGADDSTEGWGKLGFWTSDTASGGPEERMTIDKSGNVGIGTASLYRNSKMDVRGGIVLTGSAYGSRPTNDGGILDFSEISGQPSSDASAGFLRLSAGGYKIPGGSGDATSKTFIDICGYSSTSDFDRNISFHTLNSERMRITSGGNVGIGTADPQGRLHISSGTSGDCHLIIQSDTDNNNEQDNPKIVFRQDGAINTAEIGIENSGNMLAIRGTSGIVFYDGSPSTSDIDHIENTSTERMRINANGNVGIGTGSPYSTLSLRPTTIYNSQSGSSFTSAMGGLEFVAANNTNARWNLTVHDNNDLYFLYTTSGTSNWGIAGYLADNAVVDQITFTGQHRSFIDGVPYTEYDSLEGLIVSANKNKYFDIDEDLTTGANAIQISQSLPLVSLTTKEKDKACFGVISGSEDPESREYVQGSFVSVVQKQNGDRRAFINSVGEGAIWVTNINGNLESGDYITTSNVAGYGMKQDDDVLHNYTVAKITMDCDFSPATQPVQQIVKELGNVNYWVETTYSDVTPEDYSKFTEENRRTVTTTRYSNEEGDISPSEYSNLESNVQATYSEIETVTYQKIERKESTTEQEGYTLEVREELVNVLDEHGQLQWEDHPTETEKAYKIRYLDADGKITTEANKVYTAAFVGCTYHCG